MCCFLWRDALVGEGARDCAAYLPRSIVEGSCVTLSMASCILLLSCGLQASTGEERGADPAPFWLFCMADGQKKSVRWHGF